MSYAYVLCVTDCEVTHGCYFMDFNAQVMKSFDLRQLLGTWQLVGMATPEGAEGLRTGFTVKYGYISTEELSFTLNGKIEYVNPNDMFLRRNMANFANCELC